MPVLYYVSTGGREFGPAPIDTLQAWKEEGRLGPETPVRVAGARDWFPAENIAELYPDPEDVEALATDMLASRQPPPLAASTPPPLPVDFRLGSLISQIFQTYQKRFLLLFLITLPLFPTSVVLGICGEYAGRISRVTPEAFSQLSPTLPWFLPALVIHQLLWPIVCGALAVAAALVLDGKIPTAAAIRGGLAGKVRRLVGGYLFSLCLYALVLIPPLTLVPLALRGGDSKPGTLFSMLLLSGLMLSVIMTIRICIDLMVRNQVILFGNQTVWDSLRRSRKLMSLPGGNSVFQRPAWLGIMVYLCWMLVGMILGFVAAIPLLGYLTGQAMSGMDPTQAATVLPPLHPWNLAFQVLNGLAKCTVLPIVVIGTTILYRRLTGSVAAD